MRDLRVANCGAILLPLGVLLFIVSTAVFHPSDEHPMDNAAVFREYARDDGWVATHFAQWFAALFQVAGMVSVSYSIEARRGLGATVARFGSLAALLTGAAFTMLQAVNGIALKWAVDAWAAAPADERVSAFAAAATTRGPPGRSAPGPYTYCPLNTGSTPPGWGMSSG